MQQVMERLKLSREELRLGQFILQHREDDLSPDPFRYCLDLQCDTPGRDPKTKSRICELMKYLNQRGALEKYSQYDLPKFPVSGKILLELGVPKGPELAKSLSTLRQVWKESNYEFGEEELLEHAKSKLIS